MDKMRMESVDMTSQNIEKIGALFPNCITETIDENGKTKKSINFELLKQMLSSDVLEGDEAYEFTWVGKKAAIVEANKPIRKTLRPCKEESVNWDSTENLYIEGDNLEVLKLLQESYLGKVKMIYIDPPYNTGNDFIYNDDFKMSDAEYMDELGQIDDDGNRMFKNTDSNGRFHSDWCSMMYSRLSLARNLLKDDGVMFISMDDHEIATLRMICDEIFGANNFEGHIHWRRRHNQPNDKNKMIGLVAEHILAYAKSSSELKKSGVGKLDLTATFTNPDNDQNGPWASKPWKVGSDQSGSRYKITTPTGKILDEEWMGEEKTYLKYMDEGRMYFPKGGDGMPRKKYYQFEREDEGQCATNWWSHDEFGHNQGANDMMTRLFGQKNIFSNPKPIELLRALLKVGNVKNGDIVLDFFSGAASTAHAIMKLNAEDNGSRKYIMVQIQEDLDESLKHVDSKTKETIINSIKLLDSLNLRHTICEIGKERIRRASNDVQEACLTAKFDGGFRVFKLDSSNMNDVYYAAGDYTQDMLTMLESNVKSDRNDLDLLFGCLLEWGLPLSMPYTSENIDGCTVHTYNDGDLIACFDENISDDVIKTIAKRQPLRAVFRDSSFANSPAKINVGEIFKLLAPDTRVKVI